MKLDLNRTLAVAIGSAVIGGAIGDFCFGDGLHVYVFAVVLMVLGLCVTVRSQYVSQ